VCDARDARNGANRGHCVHGFAPSLERHLGAPLQGIVACGQVNEIAPQKRFGVISRSCLVDKSGEDGSG
jgi:hypothetical protein